MNKKIAWIVGVIVVVLIAIAVLFSLQQRPTIPSIVMNSTSTNQTTTSTPSSTKSPPQIPTWGQYDINIPNSLMLIDSQGRRTGEDPNTGTSYHEIPNTAYGVDESTPNHPVGELTFSNLPAGQYTLYVLGGQTGRYTLDIANNHGQQPFEGTIQKGAMIAFAQNYDPSNLASSTFSVSSTSSSTASITTAPPNNLPPPPLP